MYQIRLSPFKEKLHLIKHSTQIIVIHLRISSYE